MIEVEMSRDIREFAPKVIGPFTSRQIICLGIALAYAGPFMLLATFIPLNIRIFAGMAMATPAVACGWIQLYGLPLEQFIAECVRNMFMKPRKRPNENDDRPAAGRAAEIAQPSARKEKIIYDTGVKMYR